MKKNWISQHMKFLHNNSQLIAIPVVIILLTSCASFTIGEKFDSASVGSIRIEETTMTEVRSLFGYPWVIIDVDSWKTTRMHFGDEDTKTLWRYMYGRVTSGDSPSKFLQVDFDQAGRVTDYYYSSDFDIDKTEETAEKDFNIFQANNQIIQGKTTKSDVIMLLGNNYQIIAINKPHTSERWHFGYSEIGTSNGKVDSDKTYGKSLDIDFDSNGVVVDIRGESTFPADLRRYFTNLMAPIVDAAKTRIKGYNLRNTKLTIDQFLSEWNAKDPYLGQIGILRFVGEKEGSLEVILGYVEGTAEKPLSSAGESEQNNFQTAKRVLERGLQVNFGSSIFTDRTNRRILTKPVSFLIFEDGVLQSVRWDD